MKPRRRHLSLGGRRFITEGLERRPWSDFYHDAMTISWPWFFAVLAAAFVLLNAVFGALYMLGGAPIANARPGSFSDLFFFSVETTSTVGYGDMHPQTLFGHAVATVENFVGIVLIAVMTGLVFARFSRPRARVMFARHPVICRHDGELMLAIRAANARNSYIVEATAKLWMLGPTVTREGRRFVTFQPMKLKHAENPTFVLTWTLFHPLDAQSPLHGVSDEDLLASERNFLLTVSGLDETSSQLMFARAVFHAEDIRPGHEYVDMVRLEDDGVRRVDFAKLDHVRPSATEVTKD